MLRIAVFVDGSNLYGSMRVLGFRVENYEAFYGYILEEALKVYSGSVITKDSLAAQLSRIYWYEVGSIDEWDLDNPENQSTLRSWFMESEEPKRTYLALAAQDFKGRPEELKEKAWNIIFPKIKSWYNQKREDVKNRHDFFRAIRSSTDFIEIIEAGHLKVHMLDQGLAEKGLDTALAVDMVRLTSTYDVALVITGDADSIPSIEHVKRAGKHVGIIEFIKGYPPESKGRHTSSKLKSSADFVAQIYET